MCGKNHKNLIIVCIVNNQKKKFFFFILTKREKKFNFVTKFFCVPKERKEFDMWRSQNHCTSKESSLNLGKKRVFYLILIYLCLNPYVTFAKIFLWLFHLYKDKLRGQHVQGLDVHCIPPYVGRCVGECDVSKKEMNL